MLHTRATVKSLVLSLCAIFMISGAPLVLASHASADDVCTPPAASTPGVHWPTGSDSATFTYQCDGAYAGQWTNAYYVYNPATNGRTALYSPDYQYDCSAQSWSMTEWDFSAADGQYHQYRVATAAPSGYATNCPVADPAPITTADPSSSSAPDNAPTNPVASSLASPTTNAAPSDGSSTSLTANNNTVIGNTVVVTATNGISSTATTGDAWVVGNTTGGNAGTGNALDASTVVNMLQSSSNTLGLGNQVATFTANIDGDVTGDLFLDPSLLSKIQPASNTNLNNNLVVNNSTDATINNDIALNADSGNATVHNNTTAGNATTGAAEAVANIVNMINSAITSGQSFIGTININGNLNGDILLPANFIDQLLAANVPTVTVTVPTTTSTDTTSTVNNTNNLGINNNVTTAASSGNATVANNTAGGNTTSGNATTNVTAFNLTGSNIIGSNALLVFVNVTGKWVGVIVNAPAGTTAATLGGGISQNTTANNDTTVNNTANLGINNNVTVAAKSGDASVTDNTTAGNARTGDAKAAVNLANIENSSLSLAGWFGILFINVFGTWNGSFGVNTSAGDPVAPTSNTGNPVVTSSTGNPVTMPAQVFRFVAHSNNSGTSSVATTSGTGGSGTTVATVAPAGEVLAAHTKKDIAQTVPQLTSPQKSAYRTYVLIGSLVILYIIGDALISSRRRRAA